MCHVLSHHIKRFLGYEVIMFVKYRDSQTETHTDITMNSLNIIGSFDVFIALCLRTSKNPNFIPIVCLKIPHSGKKRSASHVEPHMGLLIKRVC